MSRSYKHKCYKCKTNYVMVTWKQKFPVCYECQREDLMRPVEDPEMQKLFDIPEELYKESSFLRDIKMKYLHFGSLTDNQIEAFKEVVSKMLEEDKE